MKQYQRDKDNYNNQMVENNNFNFMDGKEIIVENRLVKGNQNLGDDMILENRPRKKHYGRDDHNIYEDMWEIDEHNSRKNKKVFGKNKITKRAELNLFEVEENSEDDHDIDRDGLAFKDLFRGVNIARNKILSKNNTVQKILKQK